MTTNWLRLERHGYQIRTFADPQGPWDFCSWKCVSEWTTDRRSDHPYETEKVNDAPS
jgi:hypothetical protein